MKAYKTTAWQEYEAGKEYKRRIGLYETVRRNERFYRGDQWHGSQTDLPRPVFNLVRRITDYLVCAVLPKDLSISYTDDKLPFIDNSALRESINNGLRILNQNAAYRWDRSGMKALSHKALLNAALSGDGVFYCWWDNTQKNGQPFVGDIRTDLIDNTDFFVADVNKTDVQSQDYLILAGRASVESLRAEAIANGMSEREAQSIVRDTDDENLTDSLSLYELKGGEKATYLIKFYRENGEVMFEKSTRNAVISKVGTGLKYYPVAYFNWYTVSGSFHGGSPVSDMISNQKYINTAYAMAMKHMYDTAFSKVVYDKSRIPEWSNQVGEAIAAVGGGNVADAVSVIGVGKLQEGYLDLIENVIDTTKDMMGATESALGDGPANNTSAILALREASRISLLRVESDFCRCIGELASIWADMLCTYCPPERLLVTKNGDAVSAESPDYAILKQELLRAGAQIEQIDPYAADTTIPLLDKLLGGGHIDLTQYLELLPTGAVKDREKLIRKIQSKGVLTDE